MIRCFLIFAAILLPGWAGAQVVVHQAALDQLAGLSPPAVASLPPPLRPARPMSLVHHAAHRQAATRTTAAIATPLPPVAAIPVVAKPVAPPAPKPAPRIGGVDVIFSPGSAALPASAAAALKPICGGSGQGMVAIDAYAPADPADPSAAMRLSLNRAFAIRDALTACGVPAAHIIPRADGAASADTGAAKITLGRPTP